MESSRTQYRKMRLAILKDIFVLAYDLSNIELKQLEAVPLTTFKLVKKDLKDILFRATKPSQIYE